MKLKKSDFIREIVRCIVEDGEHIYNAVASAAVHFAEQGYTTVDGHNIMGYILNTIDHINIKNSVREWCEERGIKYNDEENVYRLLAELR